MVPSRVQRWWIGEGTLRQKGLQFLYEAVGESTLSELCHPTHLSSQSPAAQDDSVEMGHAIKPFQTKQSFEAFNISVYKNNQVF